MYRAYFNSNDIEKIYVKLNYGSRKGISSFMTKAKELATRAKTGAYIYMDEQALFELFQKEMPQELENRKIRSWGELMQFIS